MSPQCNGYRSTLRPLFRVIPSLSLSPFHLSLLTTKGKTQNYTYDTKVLICCLYKGKVVFQLIFIGGSWFCSDWNTLIRCWPALFFKLGFRITD